MPTNVEILQQMKKRIEAGWIQGDSAVDKDGIRTDPYNEKAVSFCLAGSICRSFEDFGIHSIEFPHGHDQESKVHYLLMEKVNGSYTLWNDTPGRTKEEVIALLDEIIQEEESRVLQETTSETV